MKNTLTVHKCGNIMHGVQAGFLVLYRETRKQDKSQVGSSIPFPSYKVFYTSFCSYMINEKLPDKTTKHFPIMNF